MVIRSLLFVLVAIVCGCSLKECPESYRVKDFSAFIKQPSDIACGPTCCRMVLSHYGFDVEDLDGDVMSSISYRGKLLGFSMPSGVCKGLSRNGVPSFVARSNLGYLKRQVSSGKPVIVLVRSGTEIWHYVVVIGYTSGSVCYADPYDGKVGWMENSHFEGSWRFRSDMDGMAVGDMCPLCGGSGRFAFMMCDLCLGSGNIDPYKMAVNAAGIHSNTLIVPKESRK